MRARGWVLTLSAVVACLHAADQSALVREPHRLQPFGRQPCPDEFVDRRVRRRLLHRLKGPECALFGRDLRTGISDICRLRPDGTVVSDAEWRTFVAEEITPRFPDGFTVFDALGQYRGRDGQIISEPTKVLLIVHGRDARLRASVQELRDVYRRRFQQESVLLIESPARAGF